MRLSPELEAYLLEAHGSGYFADGRFDELEVVKDLLYRQAFWEQMGQEPLDNALKDELVRWVEEVAPNGVVNFKNSTIWEGKAGLRYKQVFKNNFPQAFKLIFDE